MSARLRSRVRRSRSVRLENLEVRLVLAAPEPFGDAFAVQESPAQLVGSAEAVQLSHGPVSFWDFNTGGATAVDSVAGYTGTVLDNAQTGISYLVAGNSGNGVSRFDGSGDKIDVPNTAALNPDGAFSFSVWVKSDAPRNAYQSPITSRATGEGYILYIRPSSQGSTWSFWTWGNGQLLALDGPVAKFGQWQHVAATFNPTSGPDAEGDYVGVKSLYVDGVLVGTATQSYNPNDSTPLRFGAGATEGNGEFWLDGDLDSAAIYDRVLTPEEVAQQNAAGRGPISYWTLDEAGGPAIRDVVGGRDGTAIGALTYQESGSSGPTGYAVDLGGAGNKIDVPHSADLNPAAFTVETWVKVEGGQGSYRSPVTSRDDAPARGYILYAGNNNAWQFWTGTGGGWSAVGGPAIVLNQWTHVVATFEPTSGPDANGSYVGTQTLYVDGVAYSATNRGYRPNMQRPLRFGGGATEGNGNFWFDGDINSVAVYDRALTAAEVQANFNGSSLTPNVLDNDFDADGDALTAYAVANYQDDFRGGTPAPGWSYLWNAPADWTGTSSQDASTGPIGDSSLYQPLSWNGSQYTADGDGTNGNNPPSGFLNLNSTGGHPGLGSTQSDAGNTQERGAITAYTVPVDGPYWIADSFLDTQGSGAIRAEIFVNDTSAFSLPSFGAGAQSFDTSLGNLSAGDVIYVAVLPGTNAAADGYSLDYSIVGPAAYSDSGALVTMNADGSFTYDSSTAPEVLALRPGETGSDAFRYAVSDGGAPAGVATVDLTVTGTATAPLAVDDDLTVAENGGVIEVLRNDLDYDAAGTVVAGYQADFVAGAPGNGWQYLWNADGAPLGSGSGYTPLVWNGSSYSPFSGFPVGGPAAYGNLGATGGHPAQGPSQSGGQKYWMISAYTIPADGTYQIVDSLFDDTNVGGGDGAEVAILVNDTLVGAASGVNGEDFTFDAFLGDLSSGDVVYVAAGPKASADFDGFAWDFSIAAGGLTIDSVDATSSQGVPLSIVDGQVFYDAGDLFESLNAGETATDSFSYTIIDDQGLTDTATVTVTVEGENDAPVAADVTYATTEDNVLTTDSTQANAPIGYWRLNETAGTTAFDVAGNHDGEFIGSPTTGQPGALTNEPSNTAYEFPSTSHVRVPYSPELNQTDFTIEAWARVDGGQGGFRSVVTKRDHNPGQQGYLFYAASDNTWQFWIGRGNGWTALSGPSVQVGQWAHLVGTYDSATSTLRFYVNGSQVSSTTTAFAPNMASNFHIGAGGDGGESFHFNGAIDEVAYYGAPLSATEIAANYNEGAIARGLVDHVNDPDRGDTPTLAFVVADYQDDFQSPMPADGWAYLWNAPADWNGSSSSNATTGPVGQSATYAPLVWNGSRYTADGDTNSGNGGPANYLQLSPTTGHPGRGSGQATAGNTLERAAIAAYQVSADGTYWIADSLLDTQGSGDVRAEVYVNDTLTLSSPTISNGATAFDGQLGTLQAGDWIYVAVLPGTSDGSDGYCFDFTILGTATETPGGAIATILPDGSLSYDPTSAADLQALGAGEQTTESLQYVAIDGGGLVDSANATFEVEGVNDPVTIDSATATDVDEAGTTTFTVNFSDVDLTDNHSILIGWGDGSNAEIFNIPQGDRTFSATHTYVDDNPTATPSDTYQIDFILIDNEGSAPQSSTTLTVSNVAPLVTGLTATNPVDELGTLTVSGNIVDPGVEDSFSVLIEWGDGTSDTFNYPAGTTTFSETHVYADDNPAGTPSDVYTITVAVTDDDTGVGTASIDTSVENVAPTAMISGPTTSVPGFEQMFSFTADDVSDDDDAAGFTFRVDWGDGSPVETSDPGLASFEPTHIYEELGTYTVTVWATDDDTGESLATTHVVSVTPVAVIDGDLYVGGLDDVNDRITIVPSGDRVRVDYNQERFYIDAADFDDFADLDVFVYGQSGDDMIRFFGRAPGEWRMHLFGEEGDDYLAGGLYNDLLDGGDGDDRLLAGDGDNRLLGGLGDDSLTANFGNDFYDGGWGNDLVTDRGGDNLIIAGPETMPAGATGFDNDRAASGSGNDVLLGGAGHDTLSTRGGDNLLLGGVGNDRLTGGSSNDVLLGGLGRDTLVGNAGDDILLDGTSASLEAAPGSTEIDALLTHYFTLRDDALVGAAGGDHVSDGELDVLYGLAGSDLIDGDASDRIRD